LNVRNLLLIEGKANQTCLRESNELEKYGDISQQKRAEIKKSGTS